MGPDLLSGLGLIADERVCSARAEGDGNRLETVVLVAQLQHDSRKRRVSRPCRMWAACLDSASSASLDVGFALGGWQGRSGSCWLSDSHVARLIVMLGV
eukprot:838967-Rhodomonas_salina.4